MTRRGPSSIRLFISHDGEEYDDVFVIQAVMQHGQTTELKALGAGQEMFPAGKCHGIQTAKDRTQSIQLRDSLLLKY